MSVIGSDHPFFITKCFIHRRNDIVYMHAMPCHLLFVIHYFVDIKRYSSVHRFDIPYHQKYFVVPLFIWAVINCVAKPVPGRNNKH